jgi:hypothetical protein
MFGNDTARIVSKNSFIKVYLFYIIMHILEKSSSQSCVL